MRDTVDRLVLAIVLCAVLVATLQYLSITGQLRNITPAAHSAASGPTDILARFVTNNLVVLRWRPSVGTGMTCVWLITDDTPHFLACDSSQQVEHVMEIPLILPADLAFVPIANRSSLELVEYACNATGCAYSGAYQTPIYAYSQLLPLVTR